MTEKVMVTITVKQAAEVLSKLIGRKAKAQVAVNLWGDIYGRKKEGRITRIQVGESGVSVQVVFMWKAMRGYQQQALWYPIEEIQVAVYEGEDSLGVVI